MLEKQRNTLIKKAFESAKIIAPGTELTALEINDAAYTLNCMLQGWSNEGFRLFNMKTGYMPLLSKKNEYKLSTEAYSEFGSAELISVENIGGTEVKVDSILNMSTTQSVFFLNNTLSEKNKIKDIDFNASVLFLEKPINIPVYAGDDVFFGNVNVAKTEVKQYASGFSSVSLIEYATLPVVGDAMFINFAGTWVEVTVSSVDVSTNSVYFLPEFGAGKVTKPHVVFGTSIGRTSLKENYDVLPRKLNLNTLGFDPVSLSIKTKDSMDEAIDIEAIEGSTVVLKRPVSQSVLELLGKEFVSGDKVFPSAQQLKWNQIPSDIISEFIDWGTITEVPASQKSDWGYIQDIVTNSMDFKSLTGTAKILSFAKSGNDIYVSVESDGKGFLLHKDVSGQWAAIDEDNATKLFVFNGVVYAYNMSGGLFSITDDTLINEYPGFDVEFVVKKDDVYYLVSKTDDNGRKKIVTTKDFLVFEQPYTVPGSVDFSNYVEFKGKIYCGHKKTFVSADMKSFSDIGVYAENRAVIGNTLQNFNTDSVCSYSNDGVTFYPMPLAATNVSASVNTKDCAFVAVYGKIGTEGIVGSQVFSANDFGDAWTPQISVSGKVSDMYESNGVLYIVSDTEVASMDISANIKAESVEAYLYGSPIGRPQEVMNVVKYGLKSGIQMSMEALALKDYSQLPHANADGEPVSYCFFRDAKDGKMMIWGTPKQFGEYLKFTYVEPIALLEDARAIPDIPDEYVGVVIDGLAAELAHEYALPTDKTQALIAKAQESKQVALMNDNENVSYFFEPNRRGL